VGIGYRYADIAISLIGGDPDHRAVAFGEQKSAAARARMPVVFETDVENRVRGELAGYFQQVFLSGSTTASAPSCLASFLFSAIGSETITFEAPFLNAIFHDQ